MGQTLLDVLLPMGSMMCCARGPNGACSLTHTKPSEGETFENIAWRLGNIQTGRHGIVPYRFAARKVAPQNVACTDHCFSLELTDDSSFYHAGIKNVVANISDWHPFKNQKQNMHICFYLLDMSDTNTTAAAHPACQTLPGSLPFQTKK